MSKYIPTEIVEAKKQGFSSPDASWFKGESIEFVKKRLLGRNNHYGSIMDTSTVHRLINEHVSGEKNRRLLVWSLLNIEEWIEQYA